MQEGKLLHVLVVHFFHDMRERCAALSLVLTQQNEARWRRLMVVAAGRVARTVFL